MRRTQHLTIGLAAVAAFVATVAVCHPGHPPIPAPLAVVFALKDGAVPFTLFRDSRLFVGGAVNGHAVQALLDSGAGITTIDAAYAASIGIANGSAMSVGGASGAMLGHLASGVTLTVGGLTLKGMTVLVLDLGTVAERLGRPLDLIVGREAFQSSVVAIDFDRKTVMFTPPGAFIPPPRAARLTLTPMDEGIRKLPIAIDGKPLLADLDLGHDGALMLSRDYWQSSHLLDGKAAAHSQRGGVGGFSARRLATVGNVTVAGRRFDDVPTVFNEEATDLPTIGANIGIDLLRRFNLAVDYGRDAIYMTPNRAASTPLPKDRAGMALQLKNGRLSVAFVSPEGPAAAAGWHVGDQIESIAGERAGPAYYSGPNADWMKGPAGTRVDIVRADGVHLPVTLRDYF